MSLGGLSAPGFGAETTNYPIFFHSLLSLSSFIFIVPKPRTSFMLLVFEDRRFQFHRWTQTCAPQSSSRFPEPCGTGWLGILLVLACDAHERLRNRNLSCYPTFPAVLRSKGFFLGEPREQSIDDQEGPHPLGEDEGESGGGDSSGTPGSKGATTF